MTEVKEYQNYVQERRDAGLEDGEMSFDAWMIEAYQDEESCEIYKTIYRDLTDKQGFDPEAAAETARSVLDAITPSLTCGNWQPVEATPQEACAICAGDCASANPPILNCPMRSYKSATDAAYSTDENGVDRFSLLSIAANYLISLLDTRDLSVAERGLFNANTLNRLEADIASATERLSDLATMEADEFGHSISPCPCDSAEGAVVATGLNLENGLLSFNGREIGEVYECDDSTRDNPIYRCQLYGGVNSRRGFTTKEAAGQELMNDAVAWLWQLHSDLNPHSLIAALQYVLPLAKAYVAANPVGSNQDHIDYATQELEHALSVLDEKPYANAPLVADEEELPW